MTKKDAEVMHPCGGEDNIVVEFHSLPDATGECVQARLMTKFGDGLRFGTDVLDDRCAPVGIRHADSPFDQSIIGAGVNPAR
jgi:hypothetical protein